MSTVLTISSDAEIASLFEFVRRLPKVELHAHLNGCIRESTLFELAQERQVQLNPHHFGHPVSHSSSGSVSSQQVQQQNDHSSMYNIRPRSLQDCFDMFAEIPLCVNDLVALRRITQEALDDFASQHVIYLELRSTPKRLLFSHKCPELGVATKQDYVDTILRVMQEFHALQEQERYRRGQQLTSSVLNAAEHHMQCRLVISMDRSQSLLDSYENLELAVEAVRSGGANGTDPCNDTTLVVGVDLGGNPLKGDFRTLEPLFQQARQAGLYVTLHCAEVGCHHPPPAPDGCGGAPPMSPQHLAASKDSSSQLQLQCYQEARSMLMFRPDRVGHALLLPPDLQQLLKELRIPVETCPTSNVMTLELARYAHGSLIHGLQQHTALKEWLFSDHPLAVCTDDPGVFCTTSTQEVLLLALAFGLSRDNIVALIVKSMQYAFCDSVTKEAIKKCMTDEVEKLWHGQGTSTTKTG